MEHITALDTLIEVAQESTVSRTVLKAEGARVVLFAFDAGQELTEHTAAVPILLQVLDGHLRVGADGEHVELTPGGWSTSAPEFPTRSWRCNRLGWYSRCSTRGVQATEGRPACRPRGLPR